MPMPATNRARMGGIPLLALGILCAPPLAGATPAADGCPKGNLLAGALPARPAGVLHPERLTDAVAALEGDDWQVELVATVRRDAELTFDLGQTVRVRSAFLQGDHRGPYVVQG